MHACIHVDMDQATQIRMLRRAMKAAQLDEVGLSKASKVDVTMIRKYLAEDPDQWVEIGKKNAPALAKALSLPVVQVLYGTQSAA